MPLSSRERAEGDGKQTVVGLGISLDTGHGEDGKSYFVITGFPANSAGERAGLQIGDVFLQVAGIDVVNVAQDEFLSLVKGPVDSEVAVLVDRATPLDAPPADEAPGPAPGPAPGQDAPAAQTSSTGNVAKEEENPFDQVMQVFGCDKDTGKETDR